MTILNSFSSQVKLDTIAAPIISANLAEIPSFPGPDSSLGISTKSCNQDATDKIESRSKRNKKREVARNLIGGRLEQCGRVPVPVRVIGEVIPIPDLKRNVNIVTDGQIFDFGGLMYCGSVWSCPVCASIITEGRRQELIEAHRSALEKGLSVSMLTLTVPHYYKDRLQDVLDGLTRALRRMKNRKAYKQIKNDYKFVGDIRTLEGTYGLENGWHPHFHILIFSEKKLTEDDFEDLRMMLLLQWQSACESVGLPRPNEHGVTFVDGTWAARYCSKWGIEEEMTKGHLKDGQKDGHIHPFALLDMYAEGDKNAGEKFKEYVAAFHGKRQLVWSKGLRDLLGMGQFIKDEEIIEMNENKKTVFTTIPYEVYRVILDHDKREECLTKCYEGIDALNEWIKEVMLLPTSFKF